MDKLFFQVVFVSAIFLLFGCDPKPPAHITDLGHLTYLGFGAREVNCSRCHGDEGQGGMFGPKLQGVVERKGEDYVRQTIREGKGQGDDRMPAFSAELTAEQIEQLIRFLSTWRDSAGSQTQTDSVSAPAENRQ